MLTQKQKKERGWYYVGHDKYYWRHCDYCGTEYQGMGKNFCSRKCSANLKILTHTDGTESVVLKKRSTGHNYGALISKAKRGKPNYNLRQELHHNWKGGVSKIKKTERNNLMLLAEYKEWRRQVFERDLFKCVICGCKKIEAHHIKSWAKFPGIRYEISNGISVCREHHPIGTRKENEMVELFSIIINKKHQHGI